MDYAAQLRSLYAKRGACTKRITGWETERSWYTDAHQREYLLGLINKTREYRKDLDAAILRLKAQA